MKLQDIENLSHFEIKARTEELVKEAAASRQMELATRFLRALCDAKKRDVLLGEQAVALQGLQDENAKLKAALAALKGS